MPQFTKDCITAFNEMNTQESPNDFFVAALEDSLDVSLAEKGKGGMARVKEILTEQFSARTAVCVFRVTAVDDRENTVSYRTKLIHVIWTGPKTPVMKRAKVGSYNADFKRPFNSNLYIQTDDISDLSEAALERSLRASGGAHAPNRYDFTNTSAPGASDIPARAVVNKSVAAPAAPAAPAAAEEEEAPEEEAPAPEEVEEAPSMEKVMECMSSYSNAFQNNDVAGMLDSYTEASELVVVESSQKTTQSFRGLGEIEGYLKSFCGGRMLGQTPAIISSEEGDMVAKTEWSCADANIAYASGTFVIVKGKIALHTRVIVDA